MLVRKQIELEQWAMLRELSIPVFGSWDGLEERCRSAWGEGAPVVTLSARSAFDLYLSERGFSEGDEIVMTGANIPDMATVARHHGLRVRGVDFELGDLVPTPEAVSRMVRSETRAIVVAQLFGSRVDLEPFARIARTRGIDLVEDAAQAFDVGYRGDPNATLSLFSFGPIKTHTALGGAIATVRDEALASGMVRRASGWSGASGFAFRRRIAKYLALTTLGRPAILKRVARRRDLDDLLAASTRSFVGRDLVFAIRERPSRALLRLLARRLASVDDDELARRRAAGEWLTQQLAPHVEVPSHDGASHAHWVFPILCDNPSELVAVLRAAGLDATRRATLAPITESLPTLHRSFERLVYLPFSVHHAPKERERLAALVVAHARTRAIPASYSGAV